jgi:DNA-binding PadR family transcriptional regulator
VTVGAVKRVIGGVAARKTILRQLLDGPQTGLLLRAAIARRVEKPVDEISDAMLYFNLQHLENHGLIERFRDGKEKAARIVPHQVQSVRRVLAVEAPVAYLGAISQDPGVLTAVPKRIRAETAYRPVKFHYFLEEATVRRLSGVTADRELHEVPSTIFNDDLEQMYALVRKVATDLIQEYALLVDLTGAGKVCALALFRLAHDYDLPCIHVSELGAISWLHR